MWGPSAAFFILIVRNGPTVWPLLDGSVAKLTKADGSACRRNQQPRVPRNTFRVDLLEEGTVGVQKSLEIVGSQPSRKCAGSKLPAAAEGYDTWAIR